MLEQIKEFISANHENFRSVHTLMNNQATIVLNEKVEEMDAVIVQLREMCHFNGWRIDLSFGDYNTIGEYGGTFISYNSKGTKGSIDKLLELKDKLESLVREAAVFADTHGLGFTLEGDFTYFNKATGGNGWNGSDASC